MRQCIIPTPSCLLSHFSPVALTTVQPHRRWLHQPAYSWWPHRDLGSSLVWSADTAGVLEGNELSHTVISFLELSGCRQDPEKIACRSFCRCGGRHSTSLILWKQWFLPFLMPQPFNTVHHVVVTPASTPSKNFFHCYFITRILLLL